MPDSSSEDAKRQRALERATRLPKTFPDDIERLPDVTYVALVSLGGSQWEEPERRWVYLNGKNPDDAFRQLIEGAGEEHFTTDDESYRVSELVLVAVKDLALYELDSYYETKVAKWRVDDSAAPEFEND